MSDQELYEIAQQRIDRRNRRWTLWAFNLAGLILSVAAVVFLSDTPLETASIAFMLTWAALFVPHTILAAMAQSRDEDIDKEVFRLRQASSQWDYEKPKRLRLTEDGEITDHAVWEDDQTERSQH